MIKWEISSYTQSLEHRKLDNLIFLDYFIYFLKLPFTRNWYVHDIFKS
jgi:hypothetical protein